MHPTFCTSLEIYQSKGLGLRAQSSGFGAHCRLIRGSKSPSGRCASWFKASVSVLCPYKCAGFGRFDKVACAHGNLH